MSTGIAIIFMYEKRSAEMIKKNLEEMKDFCKKIKYFEHIKLIDGCVYTVDGFKVKKNNFFTDFYSAVRFAYRHKNKLAKRYGSIQITIYNPNYKLFTEHQDYIGHTIFEFKEVATECAKFRDIYISPNFERIYMECFEVVLSETLEEDYGKRKRSTDFYLNEAVVSFGHTFSYDYELLYNKPFKLKENTTYISSFKEAKDFHYYSVGKKATKVRAPMTLKNEDIAVINNAVYNGYDIYYGVRGYTQRSTASGLIIDWFEETFDRIVPIASLTEYTVKRPKIKGIIRYKVTVSIDNNTDNSIIDTVYVDCKEGDIEKAKREALNNHWSGPATILDIQAIPDGEWI